MTTHLQLLKETGLVLRVYFTSSLTRLTFSYTPFNHSNYFLDVFRIDHNVINWNFNDIKKEKTKNSP